MNTIFWHSPKAIYMAAEVHINGSGSLGLAASHLGWAPQLTGLARLRPSKTDQANNFGHDLPDWHDTPGQYIECTCKTTKYIASKQTDDKARTKHMHKSISKQLLSMA